MLDLSLEGDNLIIQLIKLLDNWDDYEESSAMPIPANNKTNPIKIFVIKIHSTNVLDQNYYICSIQFDIEEFKTYARAIQGSNVPQ